MAITASSAGGIEHAAAIRSAPAVSGSRATASPVTISATTPRRFAGAIVASESGRGGSNRGYPPTSCQMCAVLEDTGVRPLGPEDHGRRLGPNSWQHDRDAVKTGAIERVLTHMDVLLAAINALRADFRGSPPPVPSPGHVLAMSSILPRPKTPAGYGRWQRADSLGSYARGPRGARAPDQASGSRVPSTAAKATSVSRRLWSRA